MIRKLLLSTVFAAVASTGFAADLPIRANAPAPFAAPIFTWAGFYVGLNAGYSWGSSNTSLAVPVTVNGVPNNINATAIALANNTGFGSLSPKGFTGGLQAGYNWQYNSLVLGVEADLNFLNLSGNRFATSTVAGIVANDNDRVRSNYMGTVRGRLGFAVDRALFFVTGGVAFTDAKVSRTLDWTFADPCPAVGGGFVRCHSGSASFRTGWTLGGGIEYALTNNWTVKGEYLYADFGKKTFTTFNTGVVNQALVHSATLRTNTLRLGVNYKF